MSDFDVPTFGRFMDKDSTLFFLVDDEGFVRLNPVYAEQLDRIEEKLDRLLEVVATVEAQGILLREGLIKDAGRAINDAVMKDIFARRGIDISHLLKPQDESTFAP